MKQERRRHVNYLPVLCISVSAALFLLALGLWSTHFKLEVQPQGDVIQLEDGQEVTLQLQEPQLPNGCEVTSLAILLGWAGYPVDKLELYQGYLPCQDFTETQEGQLIGGDPEEVYVGDPTSETEGWYCFEGPIVEAANAYLQEQGSTWTAEAVSGLSRRQLNGYLEDGVPLVVWVTLDYQDPADSLYNWYLSDGTLYQPYANLHCVVVVEWGAGGYLTADPLEGWQWVEGSDFWDAFDAMGRRAVTLRNE